MKFKLLNFKLIFSILIIFFGIFGLAESSLAASSYYVDNSVGSSGSGSSGSPWKNLSNINWSTISSASKPCTIYISGGATSQTYNEQLTVGASGSSSTWPYDGTPTGEIIIKRPSSSEWSGHSGIVYIRNNTDNWGIDVSNQSNIIFDGLDFSQTYTASHNAGLFGYPADHIVVRNCTTKDNSGAGIAIIGSYITIQNNILGPNLVANGDDDMGPNGSHYMVENNYFECGPAPSGGYHGDCVHFGNGGDDFTFRYNLFRVDDVAYTIYIETDQAQPSYGGNGLPITNVKIYGNIFETYSSTIEASYTGLTLSCDRSDSSPNDYSTVYIYNNTFINNNIAASGGAHAGFFKTANCNKASQVIDIRNNIFYNSLVWLDVASGTLVQDYNLYYTDGVQEANIIQWPGEDAYTTLSAFKSAHSGYETHGQQGNPNLQSVNNTAGAHDVRLTSNSTLAIGTGDSSLGSTYQNGLSPAIDESAWPGSVSIMSRTTPWDIGAYEYVFAGDTTPPASPTGLTVQ